MVINPNFESKCFSLAHASFLSQAPAPPIFLAFASGDNDIRGKQLVISNINACQIVADAVRTTLGPRGMDKMMVDSNGKAVISNDGATIMKLLDVVHPAGKMLVDIARSQDAEVCYRPFPDEQEKIISNDTLIMIARKSLLL